MIEAGRVIGPETMRVLVEGLRDGDPLVREWAILGLLRRKDCAKAIEPLLERLRDERADLRWYAARAIGLIGVATPEVEGALLASLADRDVYVRCYAAWALSELGLTTSVPKLRARIVELGVGRRGLEAQSIGVALARLDTARCTTPEPSQGLLFTEPDGERPDERPRTKSELLREDLLRTATATFVDRMGTDLVLRGRARITVQYSRSSALKQAVISLRGPACQICGHSFLKKDGLAFSECHHVVRRADGGRDHEDNLLVVCANHHRELHYADVAWPAGTVKPREVVINGKSFSIRWTAPRRAGCGPDAADQDELEA